jgi:hypothetical protein
MKKRTHAEGTRRGRWSRGRDRPESRARVREKSVDKVPGRILTAGALFRRINQQPTSEEWVVPAPFVESAAPGGKCARIVFGT